MKLGLYNQENPSYLNQAHFKNFLMYTDDLEELEKLRINKPLKFYI